MANKIIIAALGAVVVGGGAAYAVIWNQIASNITSQVEASITKSNEEDPFAKLTYESISTQGFPMSFDVTLTKPVITLTVPDDEDYVLDETAEDGSAGTTESDNSYSISWDESIHLSTPVVGKSLLFGSKGPIHIQTGVLPVITVKAADKDGCRLDTHTSYAFNQDKTLFSADEAGNITLSDDFAGLHCAFNQFSLTADNGAKALASADQLLIAFSDGSTDKDTIDTAGEFRLKNLQIQEGAAAVIDQLYASLDVPASSTPASIYTASGIINANLAFSAKGTPDALHIQVPELNYNDNLVSMNGNVDVNTADPAAESVKAEFISEFKPSYDKLMNEAMKLTIFDSLQEPMVMMLAPGIAQYANAIPENQRDQFITDIMPSYERLGKLVLAVDASRPKAAAPADPATAPQPAASEVNVNRIELSSGLGGFSFSGAGETAPMIPVPQAMHGTLTCLKCTTMIDELLAYQRDLMPHITAAAPETARQLTAALPTAEVVTAFKSFLQSFAKDAASADLVYEIAMKGPDTQVNGKSAEEITVAFFNDVASKMPAPEPAAEHEDETTEDAPVTE